MRTLPLIVLRLRSSLRPRRLVGAVVEIGLLAGTVLLIEAVGEHARDDGSDLVGFLVGGLLASGLVVVARAGYLPGTQSAFTAGRAAIRRALRRLDPPAGVAFRLPTDPPPKPDGARRLPTFALGGLSAAALLAGPDLLDGLVWTRDHVAYAPYLLGLGLIWAAFAVVTTIALVSLGRSAGGSWGGASGVGRLAALRAFGLALAWIAGAVLLAWIPGIVPVALAIVLAGCAALGVSRPRPGRYWLYRREREGGFSAITVHGYLASYFVLVAASLVFVTALAQAPRLWTAITPHGPFLLTHLLGLTATVSALFLLARTGVHVLRLLGRRRDAPEVPLVPTIWWPGGDGGAVWARAASRRGWRVRVDTQADSERLRPAFDLVVGREADPRRFTPDPTLSSEDAAFLLDRKFHVVKRREFYRRLHSLFKQVTARPRPPGSGYLFCPHAWPVPGLVRDTTGADAEGLGQASIGGMLVGRPYALLFSLRLRRYLGGVLRALDLDVIYWEDPVTWTDLRGVLGVLFETYDQGRSPVLDRHFIGLPRVVVAVQEAEDGDEAASEDAPGEAEDMPPPLRARALVIRRDRGGREAEAPDRAPSSHQPVPAGV